MLFTILALLATTTISYVHAQAPDVPHGGGNCTDDWDCSLGGICSSSSNTCECDIWFTGPSCSFLNLQTPENLQGGTCGSGFDSYYSWGGRALIVDNEYHLFASFMCKHQNLGEWTTVSASTHLISPSPAGPYEWNPSDCNTTTGVCTPVIIPWSHNTVVAQNLPGQSPQYLIYHIGDGHADPSFWYPCFNLSEIGSVSQEEEGTKENKKKKPLIKRSVDDDLFKVTAGPGNTAYVQTSDNINGPYIPSYNNTGVPINFTGSWTTELAGNPAPLLLANGTVLLYFTATPCPPNSGALAANCIAVAVSENGWMGPYSLRAAPHPITYPESEDPFVFQDPRGNFHLLTNVNTCHARCAQGVPCGGHAWSRDGLSFSNLTIGAFGPVITFANGTVYQGAYVERPLVVQAADGTPLAFHVGFGRSSYSDSCNWPQLFCTSDSPAGTCGPTFPPPPPPPHLVKLMNNGQCLMFNSSSFPCSGTGASSGCPVVMGNCSDPGAVWAIPNIDGQAGNFVSNTNGGLALDVDCDSPVAHTLVKVLASGPSPLTFSASSGTIAYTNGMCLNTGQGPAKPPCGPSTEKWVENQIQLGPCSDASTQGWTSVIIGVGEGANVKSE